MTPTRRIIRARFAELAKLLPRAKNILEIGIAGDDPPGANREFFIPKEGGSYRTLDRNVELKPDILMDIEDGSLLNPKQEQVLEHLFELVICSQVLEHCWNIRVATRTLWRLTTFGGMCLVDVPFLYPPHGTDTDPDYWRPTPQGLERLLRRAGFMRIELWSDPAWLLVQATCWKGVS